MNREDLRCKCGAIFAGCKMDAIDDDWKNDAYDCIKHGGSIDCVEDFHFEKCTCEKIKQQPNRGIIIITPSRDIMFMFCNSVKLNEDKSGFDIMSINDKGEKVRIGFIPDTCSFLSVVDVVKAYKAFKKQKEIDDNNNNNNNNNN